jgi:hypothetical protein
MAQKKMSRSQARDQSVQVQTRTVEVGDLFSYDIENPVTVKRGQSALVPILQSKFKGKRVAIYNANVRDKNPMSAVLFENTTGMTLEGGPVTVLEKETYVGEAMLETIKPEEERLVPYSVELGCVISMDHKNSREDVFKARIHNGHLYLHRYQLRTTTYLINNKGKRDIDLFLDHRFVHGWDLIKTQDPHERTESFFRFRTDAPGKKTSRFTVVEKGEDVETHTISTVGTEQIGLWLKARFIDKETEAALEKIVKLNASIARCQRELKEHQDETTEIFNNQKRLRDNLKSLGTSSDEKSLRERYIRALSEEEDRLSALKSEMVGINDESKTLNDKLRRAIRGVKLDRDIPR